MPSIHREPVGCSICGTQVERRFSHRNRAGAYICRPCLARTRDKGRLVELWERARIVASKLGTTFVWALAAALLVTAATALIFMLAGE